MVTQMHEAQTNWRTIGDLGAESKADLEIASTYLHGFLIKDARHWRIGEYSQELNARKKGTTAVLNSSFLR